MLMLNELNGFWASSAASAAAASLSYITTVSDTANNTTYTFSTTSIGAADSTRRVVVIAHWHRNTGADKTISSATIGGVSATIHVQATDIIGVGIISALVPTGTTADIVVTLTGGADRMQIGVWRAINETASSPHATASDNVLAGAVLSTTIDIPATGWLVAGAIGRGGTPTSMAWTGVTEDYDTILESATNVNSGGHETGLAVETGRTVSVTISTSPSTAALVAASWG